MSIIAAGTTTTTALSSTGNTDGTLQFQVNGTTASVTLNTLGAVGVGSTPAFGTAGQVLTSAGSTAAPTWSTNISSQWTTTGSDIYYNTGNVGIGTSSPATKLDVSASSGINSVRVINTSTDTTSYGAQSYFQINAGGNHIGGLKSTVRNLIGLSTPSLYLSTAGSYPIAFGIGDSAQPSMVFDAASNLGLGVVPSAWGTASNFEQRLYTSINTWDDGSKAVFQSGNNYYQIGSTFYYKATTEASFFRQRGGAHSWHSAASGTAGNPITFTQAMTLDASGRLLLGHASTQGNNSRLQISGGTESFGSQGGNGVLTTQSFFNTNSSGFAIAQMDVLTGANIYEGVFRFQTKDVGGTMAERLRIASSGQIGLSGANYGTSGQVLTSGGPSAAPTWATAGGAWTLLSTVTASGAATADVETTFDSTYDNYAIVATNILSSTNGANLWVRLKIGGTYQTALYSYGNYGITANSASGRFIAETSDAKIIINSVGGGEGGLINTASSPGMFTLYTQNPSNASTFKLISGQFAYVPGDGGTRFTMCNFGGRYHGAVGALTGIRFLASAGNITGTFRLYGIKNS